MELVNAGDRLKHYLETKNKTQLALARHLEVKPMQVWRYLNQDNMKLHTAQKISQFFDVPLCEFLGIKNA